MGRPLEDTWLVPDGVALEVLEKALVQEFRVELCPEYGARVTYVDSFDWRLYQAGMLLHNHGHSWTLYQPDCRLTLLRGGPLCRKKCLVDSFPEGDLRDALYPVLGARALLPLARVELQGRQLRLSDDHEQVVARLVLEEQRILATNETFRLARIFPLRGQKAVLEAVRRIILRETGVKRPISPLVGFEAGCRAAGRVPLNYSTKFPRALARDMGNLRGVDALRRICLHLLTGMRRNAPGIVEDLDPDFLHDFRVALRRTRTAIAMGKDVFSENALAPFKAGFAELSRITGPTRDLDAFLRTEAIWLERAQPESLPGLQAGFADLARERGKARRSLVRRLKGQKFERLLADWEHFLDATEQEQGPLAQQPVRMLADKTLRKHIRKVLADGRKLVGRQDTTDADLHRLRVECKKLRYCLEFFRDLYTEDAALSALRSLKALQSILGRLHDLTVHVQLALDCAARLGTAESTEKHAQRTKAPQVATKSVMENLAQSLREERIPLAGKFAGAFADLDAQLSALLRKN